jgi:hypothetical protein
MSRIVTGKIALHVERVDLAPCCGRRARNRAAGG